MTSSTTPMNPTVFVPTPSIGCWAEGTSSTYTPGAWYVVLAISQSSSVVLVSGSPRTRCAAPLLPLPNVGQLEISHRHLHRSVRAPRHGHGLLRLDPRSPISALHRVPAGRQVQEVVDSIRPSKRHSRPMARRAPPPSHRCPPAADATPELLGHGGDHRLRAADRPIVLVDDAAADRDLRANDLPVRPGLHDAAPLSMRSLITE